MEAAPPRDETASHCSSFPEPRANRRRVWFVTFLTMISAVIFGLDMGTFGIAHGLPSFLTHWCVGGGYQDGAADSCVGIKTGAPKNKLWIHHFVIPSILLNLAAAAFGSAMITPTMLPRFGHRITTQVSLVTIATGCFVHSFIAAAIDPVDGGLGLWFFGRFVLGLGVGLLFATMPQWNNELVTKELRGQTGAILQVTNILGVLIGGLVTLAAQANKGSSGIAASTDLGWEVPTSLTGFFAVALLIPVQYIPDSPVWLLKAHLLLEGAGSGDTGKTDAFNKAISVLKTLRVWRGREVEVSQYRYQLQQLHQRSDEATDSTANPAYEKETTNAVSTLDDEIWRCIFRDGDGGDTAVLEIEAIMRVCEIRNAQAPQWREFFSNEPRSLLRRTLVSIYVGGIGQNVAGMIALNNLASQIFADVGIDKPFQHTAIFDCLQLAGSIAGAICLDGFKWGGRRRNLLLGSAFLCVCMIVVGSGQMRVEQLNDAGRPIPTSLENLNFAFLLVYAFAFHATWATAWVYPAEISYAAERSRIASFAMGAHFGGATLFVGVIALLFAWSQAGTFFIFAAGNMVSFLVVYLFVVETKEKHISEIVGQFQKSSTHERYVQMSDRR